MARLLLLMDGSEWLRKRALRALAARRRAFSRLLAFHAGALPLADLPFDVLDVAFGLLAPAMSIRQDHRAGIEPQPPRIG